MLKALKEGYFKELSSSKAAIEGSKIKNKIKLSIMRTISFLMVLLVALHAESKLLAEINTESSNVKDEYSQNNCNSISGIFKVTKIIKYKSAYFILVDDTINNYIYAIISLKSKKKSGIKIKVGKSYYFELNYYYKRDSNVIYIGSLEEEYFLVENKLVHIRNKTPDREIVTTPCLNGLYYSP